MKTLKRLMPAFALATAGILAASGQQPSTPPTEIANFDGPYASCARAPEIAKSGPLDLGINFATANPRVAAQFRRALDFWSKILAMRWHEDNSSSCSIAVVDGAPDLFPSGVFALGQFTELENFHGRIAFDERYAGMMDDVDLYATAVHEIGHLLGLRHNDNPRSVMYFREDEFHPALYLDADDLRELGRLHTLRKPHQSPAFVIAAVTEPKPPT